MLNIHNLYRNCFKFNNENLIYGQLASHLNWKFYISDKYLLKLRREMLDGRARFLIN